MSGGPVYQLFLFHSLHGEGGTITSPLLSEAVGYPMLEVGLEYAFGLAKAAENGGGRLVMAGRPISLSQEVLPVWQQISSGPAQYALLWRKGTDRQELCRLSDGKTVVFSTPKEAVELLQEEDIGPKERKRHGISEHLAMICCDEGLLDQREVWYSPLCAVALEALSPEDFSQEEWELAGREAFGEMGAAGGAREIYQELICFSKLLCGSIERKGGAAE